MSKVDNDASSAPSPLILWVLLEGKPSSTKIIVKSSDFTSQCSDLFDFKKILKQEFEALKDVESDLIEFFSDKDRTQLCYGGELLADLITTDSCPLIVRYPLSTSCIIVTYKSENRAICVLLPHSSGSWDLLRKDVIKKFSSKLSKFDHAKVDDLYFEISEEWCNILIQTQLLDRKPYNEWEIKDVFTNVLHQDYDGSFSQAFNLDNLPIRNSITVEETKLFVEQIKKTIKVFKKNINVNEATVREYISIFMKTAVDHIQTFTNNSAQLYVEADLFGSKGYGPVDYLVALDDFAVLVNRAKAQDFTKGIAQNIMQLHSASESLLGKRKLEQTEFESSQQQLFGIVTTGEMLHEKNVVSYIVRILENQDDMLKNNFKCARKD
ncbi:3791_t:CDS:2 [Dentiscutata erythropus]|uniref:3791_t:CDS:1 n=1 Tax=Dentiscutata erythropus TaxID=1348616 RepID=A0A9N9IJ77_9GLOM|nr:3791_t:CDS:2 [Dentiscutata erythropus]